ncbi:MAG: NlpC/P60 family protein, partial [Rhodoferax sp.]|nr:NlpC/P60 family protein [Rhodoferax sp.]
MNDKGLLAQISQVRNNMADKTSELVVSAMGFLGVPYRLGGNSVETGFDCSGFVKAMYEQTVGLIL